MASFEALDSLTDEQLDRPIDEAHDWSGRDLIAHLVAWQSNALQVAKELAVGETSATKVRSDAEWDERGDAMNLDIQVEAWALPMDEVRRRLREVPGELRGYLTVVPEITVAEARRQPGVLHRGDDRPLHRPHGGPRSDPRRGRGASGMTR